MRRSVLLIVLGLSIPLLALLAAGRWWTKRAVEQIDGVAAWRQQLAPLDDAAASAALRQASDYDTGGLPALIGALGSGREPLVALARRKLFELLNDWEALGDSAKLEHQTLLAELLAAHASAFDATAQRVAVDLAMRMLTLSDDTTDHATGRLLIACDRVLQAHRESRSVTVIERDQQVYGGSNEELKHHGTVATAAIAKPVGEALTQPTPAPLPGEMRQEFILPRLTLSVTAPAQNNAASNSNTPAKTTSTATVAPLPLQTPEQSSPLRSDLAPQPEARVTLADATLIQLLQLWHDSTPGQRQTLQPEFDRRRITARQIEIGAGLVSPLVAERIQAVERLPRCTEFDPKPWLLWLSRDESPDVRLATLQVMGTSNEAELLRRARDMAVHDTSAEVRELAQRIGNGVAKRR